MEELSKRIRSARKARGWTQTDLAKKLGVPMTTLAGWEQGKYKPKHSAMLLLSKELDLGIHDPETSDMSPRLIQAIGYVGAGGEIHPIDDHEMGAGLEEVECPPDANPGTVAVIVRGDSMYPLLMSGSIIFYSNREKNFEDHLHRLIIAHFVDGRKAVKGLTPGTRKGLYTLTSSNRSPIIDVELDSVSKIDWIKPH